MSDRAARAAEHLDAEFSRMIVFLSGLSEPDLDRPCGDPQGPSIRHVLAHLREGTDQVVGWAVSVTGRPPGDTPSQEDPAASQVDPAGSAGGPVDDVARTVARLRDGGGEVVRAVRGLRDEQLDAAAPPSPGLADGTTPVHAVVTFIAEDLAGHRARLLDAVGAAASRA